MEANTAAREGSLKVSFKRSLYEYFFQEGDVEDLVEALAGVAHKWEEIAVAVRLAEVVRAECGEKSSPVLKLHSVLYKWIVGGHSNTKPPTVMNLKKAIEGPLVQRPDIANQLQERYKKSSCENIAFPSIVGREDILVQFKEDLIKQYLAVDEVPRGAWPPVVSKTFINLALVKTSGESSTSDYSVRGNADDILAKKEMIEYNELFKLFGITDCILILGRPGSGKTTLVRKVVKDWARGRVLQEANLVFVIALRSLNSRSDSNLSDVLSPYFFKSKQLQKISSAIEKINGRKICFILDGFDEYSSQNQNKSLIYALLQKTYLPEAMVVVTSRPAAASAHLPNRSSFKQIEVFGFSRKDIIEYIDSFPFSNSVNAAELSTENLKTFLESHSGILDLCYLPVNAAIICFLYNCDQLLPETQTEMYKHFTTSIIIRQLKQYNPSFKLHFLEDLKDEEEKLFKKLCSIAFEMTASSRQVMSHGEFTADSQLSLGLVTTDISAHRSGEYQNSYSFLHLTLQEFLAAYHISKASLEKQKEVIHQYSYTVGMSNVWKFYFGLAKFENELLVTMLTENLFESLYTDQLFPIQCAYEAKKKCITELVDSSWIVVYTTVSTYDISAIAYVMSEAASIHNTATPTTHLTLTRGMIDSYKLVALIDQLNAKAKSQLVSLEMNGNLLDSSSAKQLMEELNAGFKSLQKLNINDNDIGDDGALILAEGLKFHCSLQELDLASNKITTTGVTALMHSACPLRRLNLSSNNIGDDGAREVADKLKYIFLQELNLTQCDIGIDGAEALADAIASDVMVELHLSYADFGLSLNELPVLVNFEPSTIEHSDCRGTLRLSLEHNKRIGRECSDGIAFLSRFKKLKQLYLCDKIIDQQGAKVLTDYLLYSNNCHTLEGLILSFNQISTYITGTVVKLLHHDNIKTISLARHRLMYMIPDSFYMPQWVTLSTLGLSGDDVLSFAREIQLMQDFNYNQNYFSPIHIHMSDTPMDTQTAVAVLRELKNCNRVNEVVMGHTGDIYSEDTATELKKAFEHHKIKRSIRMEGKQYDDRAIVEVPICVQ